MTMMAILMILSPLAAIGMMLWLRHARQAGGRRRIGHCLATLLPVGLLVALTPLPATSRTLCLRSCLPRPRWARPLSSAVRCLS